MADHPRSNFEDALVQTVTRFEAMGHHPSLATDGKPVVKPLGDSGCEGVVCVDCGESVCIHCFASGQAEIVHCIGTTAK